MRGFVSGFGMIFQFLPCQYFPSQSKGSGDDHAFRMRSMDSIAISRGGPGSFPRGSCWCAARPSATACNDRLTLAMPVSCWVKRLGLPLWLKTLPAQDNISTGTFSHHLRLPSPRQSKAFCQPAASSARFQTR